MSDQNDLTGLQDALCGQLGQLVDEAMASGNYNRFESEFKNALHQHYLSIMLSVMGWGVTDAGFHNVDDFLAQQAKYLAGFRQDLQHGRISAAQAHARACLYARTLKPFRNTIYLAAKGDHLQRWTTNADIEHCGDCVMLHGQVKPADQWLAEGLYPGSCKTKCCTNCWCELADINESDDVLARTQSDIAYEF